MKRLVAAVATLLLGTMVALPAKAADKVVLMLNWYVYG